VSAPRSGASSGPAPGRNPTQKLDQSLVERYKKDPAAFNRGTTWNLLVALGLLVFAAILAFFSVRYVTLGSGGLALDAMAIFPVLLALAALDEVRWRRALDRRGGTPLPPRPPLRQLVRKFTRPNPRSVAAPPSATGSAPKGDGKGTSSS
jgi:hypothetical protein